MNKDEESARVESINDLFQKNLKIPNYQRPYKWTTRNVNELLLDIENAIEDSKKYENFKYRIGTIILYKNRDNYYEIVDGQQRVITLLLLKIYLNHKKELDIDLTNYNLSDKITQNNIHNNYLTIEDKLSSYSPEDKDNINKAFQDILQVVVLKVSKIEEAFQLFDSQNNRGRPLYPHDLLKAYHLREIKDEKKMEKAVKSWEARTPESIQDLFNLYLYPLWNWKQQKKCGYFTSSQIDIYKGIKKSSEYTYALKAESSRPYYQITEPFISGIDFFLMAAHYMILLRDIKQKLIDYPKLKVITELLTSSIDGEKQLIRNNIRTVEDFDKHFKSNNTGLNHARQLFLTTLLFYYDRFHKFDVKVITDLFKWAMMIRVDMESLGYNTINCYITGEDNDKYSNKSIPLISQISLVRKHNQIFNLPIIVKNKVKGWDNLSEELKKLNN